ncbi:transposase [Butyrivibrio sp. INlla16]|uniref:IS66 family transposase n=1 Tax=Butyrivibrio sp. INlla16 TaxID=1520807 RepID=UPI000891EA2F|nr:transposase [Butyrivibrio sp. INlla16]SDB67464.1 Transposase IS66 family protein [Butyrivibrio sp. INlla16]
MNNSQYEYITTLQYRNKALKARVEAFENGSMYKKMEADYNSLLHTEESRIHKLEVALSKSHAQTVDVRNIWWEVLEDVFKEHEKENSAYEARIKQLEQRVLEVERQRDSALDAKKELRLKLYEALTELEEEKGKNMHLKAQLNRDYENSSKPSSQSVNHKKITNNREKTGRKPGGQPGHKGHGRKKQELTQPVIYLPAPQEVLDDPDFKKTGKIIKKQVIGIRLCMDVREYWADVYYNSQTGERRHAEFPDGVNDDVNYDGTVKAFLYLLNNSSNVSIDNAKDFLSSLTKGRLNISKGMVSNLNKQFSEATEEQRKKWFVDLQRCPVLNTDFTNARCDGKNMEVAIVASPDGLTQYYAREQKGHKGIKGTPVEHYQGILVHDHDITFYSYGSDHQECSSHVLRYLKDAMENEPDRKWAGKMRALLQEIIHYNNSLDYDADPDAEKVEDFEKRYCEIIEEARNEYLDVPPSKYYPEGYNLFKRMEKFMHNHLLFLHDKRVPHSNNLSERQGRKVKRKIGQVMTYRSFQSLVYFCDGLGVLVSLREQDPSNIYTSVSEIFDGKYRWSD